MRRLVAHPSPMRGPFVNSLEGLAAWRAQLGKQLAELGRFLADHGLLQAADHHALDALQTRLKSDRLVLAFVAEFARGKSELINAIFFAHTGQRVLPASPGRTTMCPVELYFDAKEPVQLSLLPVDTRLVGGTVADLRERPQAWARLPLDLSQTEHLATTLTELTRTRLVDLETARALGFWNDDAPNDNPPVDAEGRVVVPAWRHACINVPHPLLQRGLVVLDTPGLNAVGAEPELTLSLLPTADAVVFLLAADTGVTRSDLALWRDHLSGKAMERFVVLNKIDTLEDPLAEGDMVASHVELQRQLTAGALQVSNSRVFALSAREGLNARITDDEALLAHSKVPELERALVAELLPRQKEVLSHAAQSGLAVLRERVANALNDQRRQVAEQLNELTGLRGKSAAKVEWMLRRLEAEALDFERCTTKLNAMRSVHARMMQSTMAALSSEGLRAELQAMGQNLEGALLKLGAAKAFEALCERLRSTLQHAAMQAREVAAMLQASHAQLNAEFGFAFVDQEPPSLERFDQELALIKHSYSRSLGPTHAWRLSSSGYMQQFQRMLLSKLRVVFENAASELDLWAKTSSHQVDQQLRERRLAFGRRREALQRIRLASGELELRIGQVQVQDQRLAHLIARLNELCDAGHAVAMHGLTLGTEAPSTPSSSNVVPLRIGSA